MTDFDEFEGKEQPKKDDSVHKERQESFDEEFGAETAAPLIVNEVPDRPREENGPDKAVTREDEDSRSRTNGQAWGWIGLVVAIAALFIYPVVLGFAGIVLGVIAFVRGSRTLGVWSACIGVVALLAYYVIVPFYT